MSGRTPSIPTGGAATRAPARKKTNRKKSPFPLHRWPLWKALPASLLLVLPYSGLYLLISELTRPSLFDRLLAGGVALLGVTAAMWGRWRNPFASWVASLFIWTLQFLLIGLRAWAASTGLTWWLALLFVSLFLLAWGLPLIAPKLSRLLYREQMTPVTWAGRALYFGSMALFGPVLVFSYYAPRVIGDHGVLLVMAVLGTVCGIGGGQAFSHQLFRPEDR